MQVQPLSVRRSQIPMPSVGGLLVAASTALVYLIALEFNLDQTVLKPLDTLSVAGIRGDELLLVLWYFGFAMLVFSIHRQRKLKRAAHALRSSERRFRALIENSSDGIVLFDQTGKVTYSSPANARILGNPPQTVETANIFDSVYPADVAACRAALSLVLKSPSDTVNLEYRARHHDGSWRTLEVAATNLLADPSVRAIVGNFRDITERKRSESAVRASEAELRALFAAMTDIVLVLDSGGRYLQIAPTNPALLAGPPLELLGRSVYEVFPAADAELMHQTIRAALEKQQPVQLEYSLQVDGRAVWFDGTVSPFGGDKVFWIARDITERRRTETALAASNAQFRILFDTSPDAIMLIDPNGCWPILDCNQAACTLSGYARDELVGQSVDILNLTPGIPAERAEYLARLRQSRVSYLETFHRRKDGSLVPIDVSTSLIELNGREVVLGIDRDSTERKQALQTLAQSEQRFRALVENSQDAIVIPRIGAQSSILTPSLARMLGYTPAELAQIHFRDLIHPADGEAALALFAQVQAARGCQADMVIRFMHKDGGSRWMDAHLTNLVDEPSVQGVVLNMRDMTERKQSEERIQQQVGELEAINQISNALRAAVTLQELLDGLIEATLLMVGASIGSIWLYEAEKDEVRMAAYRGWTIANPPALRRGEGIPGSVVASGLPHRSRDFSTDLLIAPQTRALVPPGQGGVCIPIRSQSETLGVLFVEVSLPRELSEAEVRLLSTVTEIAGIAIHRMRLFAQIERRLEQLTALREIDRVMLSSLDLRTTLNLLLERIAKLLGADAADVLLLNRHSHVLEYKAARGFRQRTIEQARVQLGQGAGGRAALERRTIVAHADGVDPQLAFGPLLRQEGIVVNVVVPLIAKGMVNGVLGIFKRSAFKPDAEWLALAETLAGQAALAIDNAQLFDGLQRSNIELTHAYDATIEGWSHALDLRDKETEGHTQRVTAMTEQLALAMHIPPEEQLQIRRGALLHDIGKMGVPDSILLKPGPLTDAEWVVMRMHPDYARALLAPIAYLRQALDIPYCHHEKYDGTGYPRGLQGEQIPLAARLFAVIDVWDALRSDRPYRNAWPVEKVRAHIRSLSGTHFDPAVVEAFLKMPV